MLAGMTLTSRTWLWLLGLWAVATIAGLSTRPLIPVDELRYAGVAWEMWQRGDFLVPYLNGEPYSHKPPLFFWLIHAGWQVFGVSEWVVRLISPVLALLCIYAGTRLVRQLWPDDPDTARLAALTMFASVFLVAFLSWVQIDLLLLLWVILAMQGIVAAARGDRRGWLLAGVAMGLGILSKGPVILLHVLTPALMLPFWKQDPPAGGWRSWYLWLAGAVLVAALIALSWAVPAIQAAGPAYGDAIMWGQTAGRMVESFAHANPPWWYLPWLLVIFAPWIWLPWLWSAGWRAWKTRDEGLQFCMIWLLSVLIVLSMVSGKQVKYLLPLLPAFAIYIARVLAHMKHAPVTQAPMLLVILLALLGLTGMLAPHYLQQAPWLNDVHPGWGAALLGMAALLFWLHPAPPARYPLRMAILSVAMVAIGQVGVLRVGAPSYDMLSASSFIARAHSDGLRVAIQKNYHGQFQFLGRLTRPVIPLATTQVAAWAGEHPDDYIVLTGRGVSRHYPQAEFSMPYRSGHLVIVRGRDFTPYNSPPS